MKIKTFSMFLFAAAAIIAPVAASGQLKSTSTKTDAFDFRPGGTLSVVGAPVGSIRIVGSNRNQVEITAEIEITAATEADLETLAQVTGFLTEESNTRAGVITFGTHNKLGDKNAWKKFPKKLIGSPFRVDYVINVPRFCDLEIDGGKGDLSITGVEGSMRVNFVEANAHIEVIGGMTSATFGKGVAEVLFGTQGWRGRGANIQMASGDLTIRLPVNISADIDALVLRSGAIDNAFPDLRPRDRRTQFTERSMIAKAGVGGPQMKFTVGDGGLRIDTLGPRP